MGALTTTSDLMAEEWIPEDDLLLKNAIEAGASLASLAKGAVPFSCRFDIEQLEKRWSTLLYGLGSPEQVSARIARIAEVELEDAASNPPKANRICNPKGKQSSSGGKKRVSVRRHYYSIRKRIRSEPCSADLGFLLPHNLNAGTCSDDGKPHCDDLALIEPTQNHYTYNFFPGMVIDDSGTNADVSHHAFQAHDEHPDGMHRNCLYGYAENITSVPVNEAECSNGDQHFEHNYVEKVYPNILGETPLDVVGERNPFENGDMGSKGLTNFGSISDDPGSLHAKFVGNDNIGSQVSDCTDSFHQLRYSSPSGLPIWRTMEDISTPSIALDGNYEVGDQGVLVVDDNKEIDAPGSDGTDKLNDGMCDAGLNDQAIISDSDFMNFPDTYMDFSDDDLIFMDVDDNDIVDRSCIDGLSFLSSPSDLNQDGVANASDPRATNVPETGLAACLGESDVAYSHMHYGLDDCHGDPVLDPNMPSTSHIAKHLHEFMICSLNTEDSEIPCNNHVIFPAQEFSPLLSTDPERSCGKKPGFMSSSKVISADASAIGEDFIKVKEEQVAIAPASISSGKASSRVLPKAGEDCIVEDEPYEGDPVVGVSRYAGIAVDGQNSLAPVASASNSASIATLREEKTVRCFKKPGSPETFEEYLESQLLQESLNESINGKVCPADVADNCKEEPNMQLTPQLPLLTHADLFSPEAVCPNSVAIMPTSDKEEDFSDSENDVPIYSDIEALIIDMDLDPCDEEPFLFSKEVSRYQCVDAEKNIVRVEQAAQSCMNRAISSHGALAVFFGKHLKYFIKGPEVSLGRQTEDVKVDIDLGREGRANKISRRQAIIKMDEDGTFFLKNTGKFPIIVNSKEVPPRKHIHLLSGCLVEIKDMNFGFYVNDRAVRQYIKNQRESSQENNASFDWKPDHNLV